MSIYVRDFGHFLYALTLDKITTNCFNGIKLIWHGLCCLRDAGRQKNAENKTDANRWTRTTLSVCSCIHWLYSNKAPGS